MFSARASRALRGMTVMSMACRSFSAAAFSDPKFKDFALRLDADPRFRVPFSEYLKEAKSKGLDETEASQFVEHLHDEGKVFHFKQGAVEFVYLDPATVSDAVTQLLDPSGSMVRDLVAKKTAELNEIKAEAEILASNRSIIEDRAERRVRSTIWVGVGVLVTQAVVITRLTFWDLSWDIIEPISYMITVSYGILGFIFFASTKADPAYDNVWGVLKNWHFKRLAKKNNFDVEEHARLQEIITSREQDLSLWQSK